MRAYLSSTLHDLGPEREAITEVLRGDCTVIDSYRASESALVDSCLEDVERCDIYIGVFGLRYGFIPPGHDKSITHLEYERATERGLRRFIFLKSLLAIAPMHSDEKTGEHSPERIESLRALLGDGAGEGTRPALFTTIEELKVAVLKAVGRYLHSAASEPTVPLSAAAAFEDYLRAVGDYCSVAPHLVDASAHPLAYVEPAVQQEPRERFLNPLPGGDVSGALSTVLRALERTNARNWSLLIKGEPGSGKSTVLRQLAAKAWTDPTQIGLASKRLPLVVRLRWWAATSGTYPQRFRAALLEDGFPSTHPIPDDFLTAWPKRHGASWLLLLDGLDEVPDTHVARLAADLPTLLKFCRDHGHALVLSTRPSSSLYAGTSQQMPTVTVQPFDAQRRQDFLARYLGPLAARFAQEFRRSGLEQLAASPLFLTMSASLYRDPETQRVPSSPTQLYEQYMQRWIQEALRRRGSRTPVAIGAADLLDRAGALAVHMTDRPALEDVTEIARFFEKDSSPERAAETVDLLGRVSGILSLRGNALEWQHRSYREYLAARTLARAVSPGSPGAWRLVQRWSEEPWRQVVVFLLQLWKGQQAVGSLVSRLSHQSVPALRLAVEAIAGGAQVPAPLERTLIDRIAGMTRLANLETSCGVLLFSESPPIGLLGRLPGRPEVVRQLVALATHPMHFDLFAKEAINALALMGEVDALEPHLTAPYVSERRRARFCLAFASAGRGRWVDDQLRVLARAETLDDELRAACAIAIARLGDRGVALDVLNALAHGRGSQYAIEALAELKALDSLLLLCPRAPDFEKDAGLALLDGLVRLGWDQRHSEHFTAIARAARTPREVAVEAARCVGRLASPEHLDAILGDAATNPEPAVALLATDGASLQDELLQTRIRALCTNPSIAPRVRLLAAIALRDSTLSPATFSEIAREETLDPTLRIEAAIKLADSSSPDAEDVLDRVAGTAAETRDRMAAIRGLIEIRAEASAMTRLRLLAQGVVEQTLPSADVWVRDIAALLLQLDDRVAAAAMLELAAKKDYGAEQPVQQLFSLEECDVLERVVRDARGEKAATLAVKYLVRLKRTTALAQFLADRTQDTSRRLEVMKALPRGTESDELVEVLTRLASDAGEEESVRAAALDALTTVAAASAAPALLQVLESPETPIVVHIAAAQALAGLDQEQPALPWLAGIAADKTQPRSIRLSTCESLLRAGWSSKAAAPLAQLASLPAADMDDRVPIDASLLLHSIGEIADAEKALLEFARRRDHSPAARQAAVDALVSIGRLERSGHLLWGIAAELGDDGQNRLIRAMWLGNGADDAARRTFDHLRMQGSASAERFLALRISSLLFDRTDPGKEHLKHLADDRSEPSSFRLAAARYYLSEGAGQDPVEFAPLLASPGARLVDVAAVSKALQEAKQDDVLAAVLDEASLSCAARLEVAERIAYQRPLAARTAVEAVVGNPAATDAEILNGLGRLTSAPHYRSLGTVRHLEHHAAAAVRSAAQEAAAKIANTLFDEPFYTFWELADDTSALNARRWVGLIRLLDAWDRGDSEAFLASAVALEGDAEVQPLTQAIVGQHALLANQLDDARITFSGVLDSLGVSLPDQPRDMREADRRLVAVVVSSLAEIARRTGQHDVARLTNDAAIALRPTAWNLTERALLRIERDDHDGGRDDLDRAIELNPSAWYPRGQRARLRRWQGQYADALSDFEVVFSVRSWPAAWVWRDRGECRRLNGDADGAIADFDRAVSLEPEDAVAREWRARTLRDLGRYDEAQRDYDWLLAAEPEDADAWCGLGQLRRLQTRYPEAYDAFTRALRSQPELGLALFRRGLTLLDLDRAAEALDDFGKVVLLEPSNEEAIAWQGETYRALVKLPEAIAAFTRAIELKPNDAWNLAHRAEARRASGDLRGALADVQAALRLSPDDEWTRSVHGAVLAELGSLDAAKGELEWVLERTATDSWTRAWLAWVLLYAGDTRGAETHATTAFEQDHATYPLLTRAKARMAHRALERAAEDIEAARRMDTDADGWAYTRALLTQIAGAAESAAVAEEAVETADRRRAAKPGPHSDAALAACLALAGQFDRVEPLVAAMGEDAIGRHHLPQLGLDLALLAQLTGNREAADLADRLRTRDAAAPVPSP